LFVTLACCWTRSWHLGTLPGITWADDGVKCICNVQYIQHSSHTLFGDSWFASRFVSVLRCQRPQKWILLILIRIHNPHFTLLPHSRHFVVVVEAIYTLYYTTLKDNHIHCTSTVWCPYFSKNFPQQLLLIIYYTLISIFLL
jgi:hypothetical protein